jgi:hypothetical protein
MARPVVITVREKTKAETFASAQEQAQALTRDDRCERLLVVYGPDSARVYVEGGPPSPAAGRTRPGRTPR